mmetsp:Transcript_63207/g.151027  ORF Transcript_63207/g.151027 Transcript_63207/m.151027 type:complete len:279 (-) Transcript_63207:477-1313(-)
MSSRSRVLSHVCSSSTLGSLSMAFSGDVGDVGDGVGSGGGFRRASLAAARYPGAAMCGDSPAAAKASAASSSASTSQRVTARLAPSGRCRSRRISVRPISGQRAFRWDVAKSRSVWRRAHSPLEANSTSSSLTQITSTKIRTPSWRKASLASSGAHKIASSCLRFGSASTLASSGCGSSRCSALKSGACSCCRELITSTSPSQRKSTASGAWKQLRSSASCGPKSSCKLKAQSRPRPSKYTVCSSAKTSLSMLSLGASLRGTSSWAWPASWAALCKHW